MKKALCILLIFTMLFGVVGCTNLTDLMEDATQDAMPFSFGTTENNTYRSTFTGITCTLPSAWNFYSEEEILEMNNMTLDMVGEEAAELIANADIIYDMCAANEETYSNININLEKISSSQMKNLNLKEVLEAQFATIKDGYSNMGYTNVQIAYAKATVDGKEYDGIELTATIGDMPYYCTIFCFTKGNYIVNVTVCAFDTEELQTILGCFDIA